MSLLQPKNVNSAVSYPIWSIVKTPPPFRGSEPNVGLRLEPRFAAARRVARALASSAESVPAEAGAAGTGAGVVTSPRARRRASTSADRSPVGGDDGVGADSGGRAGGTTGTFGAGCARAMTGGSVLDLGTAFGAGFGSG